MGSSYPSPFKDPVGFDGPRVTLLHLIECVDLAALVCRAILGEGLGWQAAIAGAIAHEPPLKRFRSV